jgi:GxxExxY protein
MENGLKHHPTTQKIIGVFFDVYNELGCGFLEAVYVEALALALRQEGLTVEREMPLSVSFRGRVIGRFRADLVVNGSVLVEAKAFAALQRVHEAQILNYLRATVLEVGLLLNFGPRPQFRRLLFDNTLKKHQKDTSHQRQRGGLTEHGTIRSHPRPSVAS